MNGMMTARKSNTWLKFVSYYDLYVLCLHRRFAELMWLRSVAFQWRNSIHLNNEAAMAYQKPQKE